MRVIGSKLVGVLAAAIVLCPASLVSAQQGEHRRIVIELQEPATAVVWAEARSSASAAPADTAARATAAAISHLARLEALQQDLLARISAVAPSATVIFRTQRVYDGIAMEVDAGLLAAIAALPGVKAIHPLVSYEPGLFSSVPLVGAPQVWSSPGALGTGVKVGIVDTGIDYIHKDFGGSGSYSGQSYTDSSVPWTNKVVGGWDFAGDAYDSNCSDADQTAGTCSRTPVPDPDPMDCYGHGTHVAGIVGGYGVTGTGATFTGPWTASTDVGNLRIGPGVAPGCQLYALRVFGCKGSTELVAPAMEWSVDPNKDGDFSDHLDVVNLSLGSSFGLAEYESTEAVNNAAQIGVVVVCSSGNSGDTYYVTGSPGVGAKVISVANSVDSTAVASGVVVNSPSSLAGVKPAGEASFGPDLASTGPVTANLVLAQSGGATDACQALTNAAAAAGKVVLADRGTCNFNVKVKNAQNAGARGVLVADNTDGFVMTMGGTDSTVTIPSMFTTQALGTQLKQALGSGTVSVTLTAQYRNSIKTVVPTKVDTLASSSSRGPAVGNFLKPDLTAPGDSIFSARSGSGDQGVSMGGTSMAAPHVAGTMAVLKQLHPTWSVEELKALVINTAAHDLYLTTNGTPPKYGVGGVGTGRLDVAAAAGADVVACDIDVPGQVGVSFGSVEVAGTTSLTRTVRVVNKGAAAATFSVAYVPTVDAPGVEIYLPDGATLTVPAGGAATFRVVLDATAAAMKHSRDTAVAATQNSTNRFWLTEEGGHVKLTASGRPELRVPVWAAPRPASTMTTTESTVALTAATGTAQLHLTGQGFDTGTNYPTDWTSLVSAFELQASSGDDSASQGSANASDLRFVGVASDYAAQSGLGKSLSDTSLFFGIATWGNWSTPNQGTIEVLIDLNRDGHDDYDLYNTSAGGNDVLMAWLCRLSDNTCHSYWLGGVPPTTRDTAPYNTSVVVLPVLPGWLPFTPGASRFNYRVRTATELTPTMTFDPAHPGLTFGGTSFLGFTVTQPIYKDLAGQTVTVTYSKADYQANASKGLLLLHHFNTSATRTQVVAVSPLGCALACTATVPASGQTGAAVSFQATASGLGCTGTPVYDWDFGDATAHATGATASHVYPQAGTYAWSVTATMNDVSCTRTGKITVTAGAARTYVIASAAHAPGSGTSQWRTDLAAVNPGAAAAQVTVTFVPYDTGSRVTKPASLSAGATVEWPDILVNLLGLPAANKPKGSLVVTSTQPLALASRTYNQATTGTYGQLYQAQALGVGEGVGETAIVAQVKKSTAFRTNLGVLSLTDSDTPVSVKLYSATGAALGHELTTTVKGLHYYQFDQVLGLAGAGDQALAYATVAVTGGYSRIWSYGSVVDNATGDPTTVPALAGTANGPYLVPSAAHASGAAGTNWRTDIAVVNPGEAATLRLTFTPMDGTSGNPVVANAYVSTGATREWQDVLVSLFGFASTATPKGTVKIESLAPLVVTSRTYNQATAGSYGQQYPALTTAEALPSGQSGVVAGLKRNAAYRSNLGVQNLSDATVRVSVRVYGTTGAQLGTTLTRDVPAGRCYQWDDVLGKASAGDQALAWGKVTVDTAGGKVWAWGSVVDNATGDPTTIPAL